MRKVSFLKYLKEVFTGEKAIISYFAIIVLTLGIGLVVLLEWLFGGWGLLIYMFIYVSLLLWIGYQQKYGK